MRAVSNSENVNIFRRKTDANRLPEPIKYPNRREIIEQNRIQKVHLFWPLDFVLVFLKRYSKRKAQKRTRLGPTVR